MHEDTDTLDELVQRSVQVEIPADVKARLGRHLMEFRNKVEPPPSSRQRTWVNSLMHSPFVLVPAMTTALLAIVAAVLLFLPNGIRAGRIYAATAAQLKSAHSLHYTVVIAPGAEVDFTYLAPSYHRVNCSWGTEIRSDGSGKQIVLMHLNRLYAMEEGKKAEWYEQNADLVEQLQSLPRSADMSLGERLDGSRKLTGFRIHQTSAESQNSGAKELDLWLDTATGDLDHIDISVQEPGKPLYQMHVKDIRVDAKIDPSLFDMTPPGGYGKIGDPASSPKAIRESSQHTVLKPVIRRDEELTGALVSIQGTFPPTSSAIHAAQEKLKEADATATGPSFGRSESGQSWQIGFAVRSGTKVAAPFHLVTLPASTVASVVVSGPWGENFQSSWGYDSGSRWASFLMWIGRQGYVPVGPATEIWSGDAIRPPTQSTEMRIAVAKAK